MNSRNFAVAVAASVALLLIPTPGSMRDVAVTYRSFNLPVLEDGRLVGILRDRDVLNALAGCMAQRRRGPPPEPRVANHCVEVGPDRDIADRTTHKPSLLG